MPQDLSFSALLRPTRVHEVYGAGASGFAAICAASHRRPILWIRESWRTDTLNAVGLASFLPPDHVLLAKVANQTDGLAVMEEALRDGSLPLVVNELSGAVNLTAGRRLQLAAKTGQTTGLCLISEGNGSNAAETRWHCEPAFDSTQHDSTLMHWSRKKNKSGTLGEWYVRWDPHQASPADRLAVVPPPGQ